MYLKQTRLKNGRTNLAIVEGYRENGKTKTRTIKGLGYLDELQKLYDDPVAHFKRECEKRNEAHNEQEQKLLITLDPTITLDTSLCQRKNVGSSVVLAWYHSLGIESALRNHIRGKDLGFDINAVMRLLVTERILYPDSNATPLDNVQRYFFKSDFSAQDILTATQTFSEIALHKKIFSAISKASDQRIPSHSQRHYLQAYRYDFLTEETNTFRKTERFEEHFSDSSTTLTLLQNEIGVPLSYEVTFEERADRLTPFSHFERTVKKPSTEKITYICRKKIPNDDIVDLVRHGAGFIYSHPLRSLSPQNPLCAWIVEAKDYQESTQGPLKVKSKIENHSFAYTKHDGSRETMELPIKLVAYWSKKRVSDGYSCLVTSETDLSDHEIINAYSNFWNARGAFAVKEHDFRGLGSEGWATAQIETHFLVSFIARAILQLIKRTLSKPYPEKRITEELSKLEVSRVHANWWMLDHRTDLSDELCGQAGIDLTHQFMTLQDIKRLLSNQSK